MTLYQVTKHYGRPVILDVQARVYIYGFKTIAQAQAKARDWNERKKK